VTSQCGQRIGLHVIGFEERLRLGHAPCCGIEQGALLGAWHLGAHAAGDAEFSQAQQHRGAVRADGVTGRRKWAMADPAVRRLAA
jgi:hypothetical protein